jgi:hypothetical protein
MSNPLDPVRAAFESAVGPHAKRREITKELRETDVGKDRRAQLVKETETLDKEWIDNLIALYKAMEQCSVLQQKLKS